VLALAALGTGVFGVPHQRNDGQSIEYYRRHIQAVGKLKKRCLHRKHTSPPHIDMAEHMKRLKSDQKHNKISHARHIKFLSFITPYLYYTYFLKLSQIKYIFMLT
jgi:hypothetical protein